MVKRLTSRRQKGGGCPDLTIRAHHLLCMRGFQGYGYSEEFTENLARIIHEIKGNPSAFLMIVDFPDDICRACPFMDGLRCLRDEERIRSMDRRVLELLKLESGCMVTFHDIEDTLLALITSGKIMEICGECSWMDVCLIHR